MLFSGDFAGGVRENFLPQFDEGTAVIIDVEFAKIFARMIITPRYSFFVPRLGNLDFSVSWRTLWSNCLKVSDIGPWWIFLFMSLGSLELLVSNEKLSFYLEEK